MHVSVRTCASASDLLEKLVLLHLLGAAWHMDGDGLLLAVDHQAIKQEFRGILSGIVDGLLERRALEVLLHPHDAR